MLAVLVLAVVSLPVESPILSKATRQERNGIDGNDRKKTKTGTSTSSTSDSSDDSSSLFDNFAVTDLATDMMTQS